jgi:aldose 1-epimerase
MLTLTQGAAKADLYPEIGGSIGRWSIAGQDMLRRASPAAIATGDPLGMASFPLVPYSNRIANARFVWGGKDIALRPNFAPEPHAIHGVGWKRAWTVGDQQSNAVTLFLHHWGDPDWPWPFLAGQRITLTEDHLHLALTAWNLADHPVPLGFGHHPYCYAAGASLRFGAQAVWSNGPDNLPDAEHCPPSAAFDFSASAAVDARRVDNCYAGVSGPAEVHWRDQPLGLVIEQSPSLPAAVVYIPEPPEVFCFEPVPHINDALNRECTLGGMPMVAADAAFSAEIVFRAVPA